MEKRRNSTRRPSDTELQPIRTTSFKVKTRSYNWRNPVITLKPLFPAYGNYAVIENLSPQGGTDSQNGQALYYYIDDIVYVSNSVVEYHLSLDLYATYAHIFKGMGGIVNYCTNPYYWNKELDDPRMSPGYFKKKYEINGTDTPTNRTVYPIQSVGARNIFNLPDGATTNEVSKALVICKTRSEGNHHVYAMTLRNVTKIMEVFVQWLDAQATADVPSKNWKDYFISCYLYFIDIAHAPFSPMTSSSFNAVQAVEIAGHTFTLEGFSVYEFDSVGPLMHIYDVNDGLDLMSDNVVLYKDSGESESVRLDPLPAFMRRSKYRKITVISPFDTQVINQDNYDVDHMNLKIVCEWETNNFIIIGTASRPYDTAYYSDGEILYKAAGSLGIDVLALIDIDYASTGKQYHEAMAGATNSICTVFNKIGGFFTGSEGDSLWEKGVNGFNNAPSETSWTYDQTANLETGISSVPFISNFMFMKKYFNAHSAVQGTVVPLSVDGWMGAFSLCGGRSTTSIDHWLDELYDIRIIYTQTIPTELDYVYLLNDYASDWYYYGATAGCAKRAYYEYCLRWGFPMFYKVDKLEDLKYETSQTDYYNLHLPSIGYSYGVDEFYVELSGQQEPNYAIKSTYYTLPPDIQRGIQDALTKGVWIYKPHT